MIIRINGGQSYEYITQDRNTALIFVNDMCNIIPEHLSDSNIVRLVRYKYATVQVTIAMSPPQPDTVSLTHSLILIVPLCARTKRNQELAYRYMQVDRPPALQSRTALRHPPSDPIHRQGAHITQWPSPHALRGCTCMGFNAVHARGRRRHAHARPALPLPSHMPARPAGRAACPTGTGHRPPAPPRPSRAAPRRGHLRLRGSDPRPRPATTMTNEHNNTKSFAPIDGRTPVCDPPSRTDRSGGTGRDLDQNASEQADNSPSIYYWRPSDRAGCVRIPMPRAYVRTS